jgi:Amt family ammonium transporter
MLLTGFFATKTVNGAGADGLFYGNVDFLLTQAKAVAIVVAYSVAMSFVIFKIVNLIQPLRVTSEEEELGLDASQHDEKYLQGTLLVDKKGKMEEEALSEI